MCLLGDPAFARNAVGRPFVKMHGLRNHFVIVDGRQAPYRPPTAEIMRICDVQTGVGAEQLLVIEPPTAEGAAAGAYALMRIFNIDGREVGACGNATRCVAHLLLDESGLEKLWLETKGGILACRRAGTLSISVNMGRISTDWRRIPMARDEDPLRLPVESGPLRNGVAAWIGNPHAVFFVDDLASVDLPRYAPAIQGHSLFPDGVNVGAAEMVSGTALRLAVWERPGILTQACGSGACIAAFAAWARNLTQARQLTVHLPAGPLEITLNDDDSATMIGPVAFCCQGYLPNEWSAGGQNRRGSLCDRLDPRRKGTSTDIAQLA